MVAGQQTAKTVAIVVGSAAALGFIFACLLFVRSLWKKRDGMLEFDSILIRVHAQNNDDESQSTKFE